MTKTVSEKPILTTVTMQADGLPGRMSTWRPDAPVRHLRSGERTVPMTTPKPLTPIKAIRANCLECCCGSRKEVKMCHIINCPLWPYRLGHRPVFPATTRGLAATLVEADHAED